MFIEFQVGNFRSFRDIQKFSMQAAPLRANDGGLEEDNVFQQNGIRLLKTKAIFGSNASGKSNFVEAFAAFMNMVTFSVSKEDLVKKIWDDRFQLLNNWDDQSIFFQYTFLENKTVYRYGFEILENKIELEWLFGSDNFKEKEYFIRNPRKLSINEKLFSGAGAYMELALHDNDEIFRNDSLFLTAAALNGSHVASKLRTVIRGIFILDSAEDEKAISFALNKLAEGTESEKKAIIDFIKAADIGIENLGYLNIPAEIKLNQLKNTLEPTTINAGNQKTLYSYHKRYKENGDLVDQIPVPFFDWESKGTQKLLGLAAILIDAIEDGRTLIIDEFDAKFHPLLTQKVLELLQAKQTNPKNTQLVLVTHDSDLLRKANLRRDQICFVDKDKYGISTLRTLIEYKGVRKDASYEKEYLQGRYAGVPYLDELGSVITQTLHDNGVSKTK